MNRAVDDTAERMRRDEVGGEHPRGGPVPCMYCHEQIAADRFAFWSPAGRLVSADCAACERRVTLTTKTWCRWSRLSELATT
jgi:hypothetical protein